MERIRPLLCAMAAWPKQRFACIVGAPRCGTTTLARLLENHPSVSFSNVKEPHFFSRVDLNDLDDDALREAVAGQYLGRYFPNIDPRSSVMAEASVSYLYAPERLLPLLRLWPDAKFIIAARDPLELIPSLSPAPALPGRRNGDRRREGLEADRGPPARAKGARAPVRFPAIAVRRRRPASASTSVGSSKFSGRERCEVVLFDDLKADEQAVYDRLLHFLELPSAPLPKKRKHRARHGFRIGWLQRLLKRPPIARTVLAGEVFRQRVAPEAAPRAVVGVPARSSPVRRALLQWNRVPAPPVESSAAFRREIRDTLAVRRRCAWAMCSDAISAIGSAAFGRRIGRSKRLPEAVSASEQGTALRRSRCFGHELTEGSDVRPGPKVHHSHGRNPHRFCLRWAPRCCHSERAPARSSRRRIAATSGRGNRVRARHSRVGATSRPRRSPARRRCLPVPASSLTRTPGSFRSSNLVILWLVVRAAALAFAASRSGDPLRSWFVLAAATDFLLAVLLLSGLPIALVVAGLFGPTSEVIADLRLDPRTQLRCNGRAADRIGLRG